MKRTLIIAIMAAALGGCVVAPADHYDRYHSDGYSHWDHHHDGNWNDRYDDHGS